MARRKYSGVESRVLHVDLHEMEYILVWAGLLRWVVKELKT